MKKTRFVRLFCVALCACVITSVAGLSLAYGEGEEEESDPAVVCCHDGGPCREGQACCKRKNMARCDNDPDYYYCTSNVSLCDSGGGTQQ